MCEYSDTLYECPGALIERRNQLVSSAELPAPKRTSNLNRLKAVVSVSTLLPSFPPPAGVRRTPSLHHHSAPLGARQSRRAGPCAERLFLRLKAASLLRKSHSKVVDLLCALRSHLLHLKNRSANTSAMSTYSPSLFSSASFSTAPSTCPSEAPPPPQQQQPAPAIKAATVHLPLELPASPQPLLQVDVASLIVDEEFDGMPIGFVVSKLQGMGELHCQKETSPKS